MIQGSPITANFRKVFASPVSQGRPASVPTYLFGRTWPSVDAVSSCLSPQQMTSGLARAYPLVLRPKNGDYPGSVASSLTVLDMRHVESVLGMSEGYVLDFTDSTFGDFFEDLGIDIGAPKYCIDGTSKAKRLRRLLRSAEPEEAARVLNGLLDYQVGCARSAPPDEDIQAYLRLLERLRGTADSKPAVNDRTALLGLKFNPALFDPLTVNDRVGKVLADRMAEAQLCLQAGANLAAVILSGSVLEGLCLGVGMRHTDPVSRAFRECFRRDPPKLEEWTLNQWIGVFRHLQWFSPTTEKFAHALREFRNYIHPSVHMRAEHSPDYNTALIAFQVVVGAAEDLSRMQAAKESQGNG